MNNNNISSSQGIESVQATKNTPTRKYLVYLALFILQTFFAYTLYPELTTSTPDMNDNVFHFALVQSVAEEVETGGNIIDHWIPYWSIGYPVFHHYQHFPHLATVATHYLLLQQFSLFSIFHFFVFFLIWVFPLSIYYSLRKMDFPVSIALGAAILSLTISGKDGYGLELSSYTWAGFGMYAQLWAMVLLPITLASIYHSLNEGKRYYLSVGLLLVLSISQMLFGLCAAITAGIFLLKDLQPDAVWMRFKRLLLIFVFFGFASAYFVIPLFIDSPYHAHSMYDSLTKFDSYGFRHIFSQTLSGDLFDFGRFPVFTILAVSGALLGLGKKAFFYRFTSSGFTLWYLLYLGRPTWGSLLDIFPLSNAIHFHRLVTMVDFFAILAAGVALASVFTFIGRKTNNALAILCCCLMLVPVFKHTHDKLEENNDYIESYTNVVGSDQEDLQHIINTIRELPPGRVHPGRRANWGRDFKVGNVSVFYYLSTHNVPALSYLPFSWALAGDFSLTFDEYNKEHYDLFNVRYLLIPGDRQAPAFARKITEKGKFHLYEVDTSGYFDLVESPLAIHGDTQTIWHWNLSWMKSPLPKNRQFLSFFLAGQTPSGYQETLSLLSLFEYVSQDDNEQSDNPEGETVDNFFYNNNVLARFDHAAGDLGQLSKEVAGKNQYSVTATANKECFLLFKMTYHPGWKVTVDGADAETVVLSPGLTGVKLRPGTHSIRLEYRAQNWKNLLLFLGMLGLVALWAWERRR